MRVVACISCRLRRRKCDRAKPVCTGCKDLNIPQELCVYKDLKAKTKSNDRKEILDQYKSDNMKLKNQKFRLMEGIELAFVEKSRLLREELASSSALNNESSPANVILQTQYKKSIEKDSKKNEQDITNNLHFGSISWGSLMTSEPDMQVLLEQMDSIIKRQKVQLDSLKKNFEEPVNENCILSKVKAYITSVALGIEKLDDFQIFQHLFHDIEKNLPTYKELKKFLDHQFRISQTDYVAFFSVDEETYYEILHRVLKFDGEGKPTIQISLPEQSSRLMDLAYVISYLIYIAYHRSQLIHDNHNANHMLLLEYSETLLHSYRLLCNAFKCDNSFLPTHTPEELHTMLYITTFERYTPHGRHKSNESIDNTMNSRNLTSIARVLQLNQNIDIVYSGRSENYRKSLKSAWYLLVLVDVMESLESGLPPKIRPDEILRYKDHYNGYIESLIVLNRVLYKFHKYDLDSMQNTYEFVRIVDEELVTDLRRLLKSELRPARYDFECLLGFDFDDISMSGEFVKETACFAIKFNIFSLIQTLYFICFKKLEMIDKESDETKKFNILSMKYSTLIISLIGEVFILYDKLSSHPNSYEYAVLESIMAIFPHLSLALRRVYICAGARIFEKLPINKPSAVKRFLYARPANENTLLKELHLKQEYQIDYKIEDLADYDADEDINELFARFSPLLDYRFVIFNFSQVLKKISENLFNEKSNINFVKLNHIFFYLLKLTSFFLNATFVDDAKALGNATSFKGLHDTPRASRYSDESESESEFNFKDLFEKAINTKSENFDFKEFFNNTNGIYQTTDIDDFLTTYPMSVLGGSNQEF
ncbi:hypothetical protein WICANDRAFT_65513 [Wickerhamomyces anomalus NRRL Y-366-8]|uniref:Zn(2)-C6 fungal-type domain-containing protein n=1 Tax=Wickerhamomyces anomalus (strain ATCC 58044 / CBS 1984 / NCYC 433 / NRRL Y-366-8) TaxID=683960 RepID=A0A1E3NVU5_WICAA|nr:uncharacterized protein WICANDRAFT_65513 [Wickerhamomyces anomalus NRRL Y-366-8]ODQ57256.1 hypothetical protein WICANDRAFT_65513 [Wickerhamomyces anomalus NRRL Y-366-8]